MKVDVMEEIMRAYKKEYGEDAVFEDGEMQVFELNDCTAIITMEDKHLKVSFIGDKPIKVDCTSGFYVEV